MQFEQLCRILRDQRGRIADLRDAEPGDDDDATLMIEQALYDTRLLELARMLDVAVPEQLLPGGGLYTEHRSRLEDHLAEQGVDLRPT